MARAVAAWLCRRHTEATLADLAGWLGLSRADSVPNLTRRLEAQLKSRPELPDDRAEILRRATDVPADHHSTTRKTPKSKRLRGQSKTKNKC
jgi:hypothetical protein